MTSSLQILDLSDSYILDIGQESSLITTQGSRLAFCKNKFRRINPILRDLRGVALCITLTSFEPFIDRREKLKEMKDNHRFAVAYFDSSGLTKIAITEKWQNKMKELLATIVLIQFKMHDRTYFYTSSQPVEITTLSRGDHNRNADQFISYVIPSRPNFFFDFLNLMLQG